MTGPRSALCEEAKRLRDEEQGAICDAACAKTLGLVERHRDALDRLAEGLLEHETLDRAAVQALLAGVAVHDDAGAAVVVSSPRSGERYSSFV